VTGPGEHPDAGQTAARQEDDPREAAERRRRRARVFGKVLPESTSDDRDDTERPSTGEREEWLRRQVPPHHGGR
jgi:hypothetical protein